jgi:3-hydroxymyristoyl/3-hydroxydecanoyl-(acyl carrier protein) dehydratase
MRAFGETLALQARLRSVVADGPSSLFDTPSGIDGKMHVEGSTGGAPPSREPSFREPSSPAPAANPLKPAEPSRPETPDASPAPAQTPATPVTFSREMCMEFAVGSAAKVLGPEFAAVDGYRVRVRLPAEPLMLVDRILTIEGEKGSLTSGRIVTEHDVHPGAWYLDGGKAPVCISVEAGQADLFLSAWLGIDLAVQGKRAYRLLDAVVHFHRGLPEPGDTIQYDIHIDKFVRQNETYLFFFRFEGYIGDQRLITMTDGCAGFFTETEVENSGGIILTREETAPEAKPRRMAPPRSPPKGRLRRRLHHRPPGGRPRRRLRRLRRLRGHPRTGGALPARRPDETDPPGFGFRTKRRPLRPGVHQGRSRRPSERLVSYLSLPRRHGDARHLDVRVLRPRPADFPASVRLGDRSRGRLL